MSNKEVVVLEREEFISGGLKLTSFYRYNERNRKEYLRTEGNLITDESITPEQPELDNPTFDSFDSTLYTFNRGLIFNLQLKGSGSVRLIGGLAKIEDGYMSITNDSGYGVTIPAKEYHYDAILFLSSEIGVGPEHQINYKLINLSEHKENILDLNYYGIDGLYFIKWEGSFYPLFRDIVLLNIPIYPFKLTRGDDYFEAIIASLVVPIIDIVSRGDRVFSIGNSKSPELIIFGTELEDGFNEVTIKSGDKILRTLKFKEPSSRMYKSLERVIRYTTKTPRLQEISKKIGEDMLNMVG